MRGARGIAHIRPVVAALTSLPVTVLNSHTHYDHVGGNWEFADVGGMATPFTDAHAKGQPHAVVAGEIGSEQLCGALPAGFDSARYVSRPFTIAQRVADGTRLDVGGRIMEVVAVPGHTPDAIALLDRGNGLLFTGDTFYEGPIFLYGPDVNLTRYVESVQRLARLAPTLGLLLPSHNTPASSPRHLRTLATAAAAIASGTARPASVSRRVAEYRFDGFTIRVDAKPPRR